MLSFYELNLILEKNRLNEAIDPMDFSRYAPGHSGGNMTKKLVDPGAHLDRKLQDQGYAKDRTRNPQMTQMDSFPMALRSMNQNLAADIYHILPSIRPEMQYSAPDFLTLVGGKLGRSVNPTELQRALKVLASPPEGYPAHVKITDGQDGMPRVSVVKFANNDKEDIMAKPGQGGRYASPMANARNTKVGEVKPLTVDTLAALNDKFNGQLMTLHDVQSPTFVDEAGKYIEILKKLAGRQMDDETRQMLDQEIGIWDEKLTQFKASNPMLGYKPQSLAKPMQTTAQAQAAAPKLPDASAHDRRAIDKIKADLTVERDPKKRQELLDDLVYFGGSPDDVPAVQTAPQPMAKPVAPMMGKPPVSLPPAPQPTATAKPTPTKSPLSRYIKK